MNKKFVMKKRIVMWLSCVVLLMSGAAAIAQTITGAVRGTVTDPSGAVVSGATVTATNVETGVATTTTSNRTGLYNFQFLSVGNYTITATAKGFNTASVGPFTLSIDQTAMIDTKLQVGKSATTVKVAADTAPLLNTEDATVNTIVSANTLKNMPLNGNNVQFATLFVPGAIDPTASYMSSAQGGTERDTGSSAANAVPSFSGNRQQGNNYILDGIEMNETTNNLPSYSPAPFAVQEINVVTGNAGAQYGNAAGSNIVMLTKAGTNKFHGNAWEYFENQSMAANTWQNNDSATPTPKGKFTQNQYGAAVGGPIFKNKLFFFGDYSGMHYSVPPSAGTAGVPDAKMSGNQPSGACPSGNADFSELLAEGVTLDNNSSGTASATAYPNNCIPINNPVAKYLFSHPTAMPGPNQSLNQVAGAVTAKDYLGTVASYNANNQGDVRVDYALSSKNSLMAKYTYGYANDQITQNVLPVFFPVGDNYPFTSVMLQWVHTFSPSLVNSARGGFSQIVWNQGITTDPSGLFGTHGDKTIGFGQAPGGVPYLTKGQSSVGFAYMQIGSSGCSVNANVSCFGTATNTNSNLTDNTFDYADDLTWEHGNHVTRFGVEALRYQENFFEAGNQGGLLGSMNYNGTFSQGPGSASGFADFVLDDGFKSQVAGNAAPFEQRQWRDAAYVQDDWKALPNLTINAGVRLIWDQPLYEVHNRMSSINLQTAYFAPVNLPNTSCGSAPNVPTQCYPAWFEFAGQNGNSRALYNNVTAYNDFEPRLGFDWQVNHRTVIRGGYGITDDMEGMGYGQRMTQNAPFLPVFQAGGGAPTATSGGSPLNAGLGFASARAGTNPSKNGFSPGSGAAIHVWDANLRPAMIQQFNLTAQFLINDHTSVSAGYVGEIGQHLVDINGTNQYTNVVPVVAGGTCPNGAPVGPNGGCTFSVDPYYAVEGPGSCGLMETQSNAIENYNALQVVVQHQQSNGLEYALNYTYSKSMTDSVGFYGMGGTGDNPDGCFPQNAYDLMGDYGPSSGDATQIVSATAVYQLPFGHGRKYGANTPRWEDEVVGGWELSGDAMLNSGFPVTVWTSHVNSNVNGFEEASCGFERANQYVPMKIANRSTKNWFGTDPSATPCLKAGVTKNALGSPCAYGEPGPLAGTTGTYAQQFGNDSVGSERGPGFRQIDLSLFKAFRTVGEQDVKVRFDAFNAFNFASYGTPNANINSSQFGQIRNTLSPPRQLQLSAVYDF